MLGFFALVPVVLGALWLWGRRRDRRAYRVQTKATQEGHGRPLGGAHFPRFPR
jgi:hypothetical protein